MTNFITIEERKKAEKKKFNYIKCQMCNCTYITGASEFMRTCYVGARSGYIHNCSQWDSIDPFRLFIAMEKAKRNDVL